MPEPIVSVHIIEVIAGVEWEPNAPDAVLLQRDFCSPVLALSPHFDDPNRDSVVFIWNRCREARREPFNDEAIARHPLYESGLGSIHWLGEVLGSPWLSSGEQTVLRRHYVLRTKEAVFEFLAESFVVNRLAGPPLMAAYEAARKA